MSSDGSRLRESWSIALKDAQARFRSFLMSSTSASWKRIHVKSPTKDIVSFGTGTATATSGSFKSTATSSPPRNADVGIRSTAPQRSKSQSKGKAKSRRQLLVIPEVSDVIVHRRVSKDGPGEVHRAVLDVTLGDDDVESLWLSQLNAWRAVLSTPEMRKEYDSAVQDGQILEMFDAETRISKLDFALGWPANPRDAVTISKSFMDTSTLIEVSTSLPRSADEPAYLRPAPPFVRSYIHLCAWCIQIIQPPLEGPSKPSPMKLRVTYFWQHDLRALWSTKASITQSLPAVLVGLVKVVLSSGDRLGSMTGYGHGIGISHMDCHAARQLLTSEYRVIHDNHEGDDLLHTGPVEDMDDVRARKEARRLERSIEWLLPGAQSWDVRINTRTSHTPSKHPEWVVYASQPAALVDDPFVLTIPQPITLRLSHARPPDNSIVGVTVAIEPSGGGRSTLRVNGSNHPIQIVQPRDPSSLTMPHKMLEDASTFREISLDASPSVSDSTAASVVSSTTGPLRGIPLTGRSETVQKAISNLVRRNYIYFTSLLQEPEAKWSRAVTESRGVTVTRLNSIDPTLVVYRAEAVFVGVSVWDLLSTIATPGVAGYWSKVHEDAVFLEHVNELTELWHLKVRAAWPVNARDSIQLRTTYKSPTACHVFSFSTDDSQLFPSVQLAEPGTIRTQVDLQGWAIEALSPNTTLLTLLDQSDPKGWSNKSSIPSQMISAVAGIGEFSIKHGGPPMATRVSGAKYLNSRYDRDRNVFRLDYQSVQQKTPPPSNLPTPPSELSDATPQANAVQLPLLSEETGLPSRSSSLPEFLPSTVECEIRCDLDSWAPSVDVIVDPAPQTVSCLRRHKFATRGGGVWITIEHDGVALADEKLTVVARKGHGGKERGSVIVNGVKVKVDVEEISDEELKALSKKKRIKPTRHPLDQPPVMTVRRRTTTHDDEPDAPDVPSGFWNSFTSTLSNPQMTKFLTFGLHSQTSPSTQDQDLATPNLDRYHSSKAQMDYAFDAISWMRALESASVADGWTALGSKDPPVYKKTILDLHPTIAVHKAQKIIEGFSAEDLVSAVSYSSLRSQWDASLDSVTPLQAFGSGCHTSLIVLKLSFPFRNRAFFVSSVTAKLLQDEEVDDEPELSTPRSRSLSTTRPSRAKPKTPTSRPGTYFYVTASFGAEPPPSLSGALVNPASYPTGQILLEGWVLETLDPYTDENLAIPSTKCTLISAIDLAGSVPTGYNASYMASFVTKSLVSLEKYIKGRPVPPYISFPPSAVGIEDKQAESTTATATEKLDWILENADSERSFVGSLFSFEPQMYRFSIIIKPEEISKGDSTKFEPPASPTSRPSTPAQDADGQMLAYGRGTNGKRDHARVHSQTSRSSSTTRNRILSPPSSALRPGDPTGDSEGNFLVGEVIVDPASFSTGYEVRLGSGFLHSTPSYRELGCQYPASSLSTEITCDFPILCKIEQIPPSPLSSNSLSSPHRLRIFIPNGPHHITSIDDPLRDQTSEPPPKSDWLLSLERQGALIDIWIRPSGIAPANGVVVDGEAVSVISHKSSVLLDRMEGTTTCLFPVLTRTSMSGSLSGAMKRPLASSWYFFVNPLPPESPVISSPPEVIEEAPPLCSPEDKTPVSTPPASDVPKGLFGLLNSYSNPLLKGSSEGPFTFNYWQSRPSFPAPGRWLSRPSSQSSIQPSQRILPTNTQENSFSFPLIPFTNLMLPLSHTFSLPSVLIITLIAFLLGSLLRSLLSPADFVLLDGAVSPNAHHWHEVKRLLDIHLFGRGLIVALVRR